MWNDAVRNLLPAALAVALSPIPIIAIVLVLGTPGARRSGPAFAVGWVVGLAAVSTLVVVLAAGAGNPKSAMDTSVNWVKVGIAVLFLAMAFRQWQKRPREGQETEMPAWMATLDSVTPRRALVLGLMLSGANPKNLALTLAASASIAQAGLGPADTAVSVAIFVAIGSVTVAGSVIFFLVAAERARGPLASVKAFMTRHNAVIMTVVLLVLGVKLLVDGLGGLNR